MDFDQIRYVLSVANNSSFSLAAEECYVSQSSISQQISRLEKELGVKLFHRTTRNVQLTGAGKEFVSQARRILDDSEKLQRSMQFFADNPISVLRIGALIFLGPLNAGEMYASFLETYSHVKLEIIGGSNLKLLELLREHKIEMAFLALNNPDDHPDLESYYMGQDDYCLVVSKNHPLAGEENVSLADFAEDSFVFQDDNQSIAKACIEACRDAGFEPNIICRTNNNQIIYDLITSSIVVGFLCRENCNKYIPDEIVALPLNPPVHKNIQLVRLRGRKMSQAGAAAFEFFLKWWDKKSSL